MTLSHPIIFIKRKQKLFLFSHSKVNISCTIFVLPIPRHKDWLIFIRTTFSGFPHRMKVITDAISGRFKDDLSARFITDCIQHATSMLFSIRPKSNFTTVEQLNRLRSTSTFVTSSTYRVTALEFAEAKLFSARLISRRT